MLTSGHDVFDNRIYYKEILSLKKQYDDIYMIAPGKPGQEDFITGEGVKVKYFEKRRNWRDRFRPMRDMFKLGLEIGADVYHAHEPDSFQVALKLKRKTGAKAIYDSHEYHPEAFSEHFSIGGKLVTKAIYLYEKSNAVHADYIISVNDILVNKFKGYNSNVELIPNYPVLKNADLWKEYNDKTTFIYIGRMTEDRGIMKILEGIKYVKHDCRYLFVGEFDGDEIKTKAENFLSQNLKDVDIEFTGKVNHLQVFDYLKAADAGFVLLQPYSWRYVNSEPIKLFEYMMSKTAVIASDFPMMKNIVEKSNCGVTVKPDDPLLIAKVIDEIAENRERYKNMAVNGFEGVRKYYNWNVCEDRLLALYREL